MNDKELIFIKWLFIFFLIIGIVELNIVIIGSSMVVIGLCIQWLRERNE